MPRIPRFRQACLFFALATAAVSHAAAQDALAPPAGASEVASLAATGVQVYVCKRGPDHRLAWTFQAPQAELYDAAGKLAVKHYVGPSWEAGDGSKITGKVLKQAPGAEGGAIPQLLLQATQAGGPGLLAPVRYVQRLDTHGGAAPSRPCTQEGQEGRSPYLARYVFLR
jgi:hypothetical protein